MMKKTFFLLALTGVFCFGACNKTKQNSARLMKGGRWEVTELSVDGTMQSVLPELIIEDCDIYDETCYGEWEGGGGHAYFAWQFRDKGATFELSRQNMPEDGHSHGAAGLEMEQQCYDFSGVYQVDESSSTAFTFSSSATGGFSGKKVVMKLVKE
jgi:hypothetical protein